MWYELARKLRFVQKSEDTKIDEIFMVNLLDEIKKSELEAINILLQNYEILEEILCCGK